MGILRRAVAYDGLDARVLPHELLHAQPAATVPLADTVVRDADDDHVAARVPCHRHPSSRIHTRDCLTH